MNVSRRRRVAIAAVILSMVGLTVPVVLFLVLQRFPPVAELIDEGVRFRNLTIVLWIGAMALGSVAIVVLARARPTR